MYIFVEYIKTVRDGTQGFLVDSPSTLSSIIHDLLEPIGAYYMVYINGTSIQEDYFGWGKARGWIPKGYNPFSYLNHLETEEKERQEMMEKAKDGVIIHYNNELGYWVWSVVVDDDGYWLDSFKSFKDAVDFCQEHNFPRLKTIKDE